MGKKTILWKKWHNPYKLLSDCSITEEDDGYDTDATVDLIEDDDDNNSEQESNKMMLFTALGPVPLTEYNDPGKIFNFWIGHTNFNISKPIKKIINDIDGVEILNIYTRYRFRIGVGHVFSAKDVTRNINRKISEYFRERDGQKEPLSGPDNDSTGPQCQSRNE